MKVLILASYSLASCGFLDGGLDRSACCSRDGIKVSPVDRGDCAIQMRGWPAEALPVQRRFVGYWEAGSSPCPFLCICFLVEISCAYSMYCVAFHTVWCDRCLIRRQR